MSVVKLSRSNNVPWGFRIHGGQDFNTPLIVLKVTGGSISEQAGVSPGDAILRINNTDALTLKHKQAQDLIVGGGNNLELTLVKNATSTWKPQVLTENNQSRTSLKSNAPAGPKVQFNAQINNQAKPYSVQLNEDGNLKLVNNQFNTPINLYSEQNIAETLSAQAEVLAGGAIGVNFKKNEKKYSYENSEVYKMLQEVENERSSGGLEENRIPNMPIGVGVGGHTPGAYAAPPQTQQLRPVRTAAVAEAPRAPQTIPPQPRAAAAPAPAAPPAASGANPNVCADCERLIVGVFVRIKDKNLHVECFKCATCGQSLKNIGYYNINGKLYCDVHAKTVARANPPAPGLEPYTTLPTAPVPAPISSEPAASGPESNAPAPAPTIPLPLPPLPALTESNQSQESPSVLNANKPFSYTKGPVSPSVMAPLPYHPSSPGQVSHVTAPTSSTTQISQSIKQTSSSSYSSSETVTKSVSPGSKFVWPPSRSAAEDEIMGVSLSDNLQQQQIFQQQQQQLQQQQQSFQQVQNFQSQASTSLLQQSIPPLQQSIPPVQQSIPPLQQNLPSLTGPPSFLSNPPANFKPVSAPKPFAPKQVPYKPLSTLLQPAVRAAAPAAPQAYVPPPFAAAPAPAPTFAPAPAFAPQPFSAPPQPAPAPRAAAPAPAAPAPFAPGPPAPSAGAGAGGKGKVQAGQINPIRGRGVLTQPGPRVAVCNACHKQIRGPFITAGVRFFCPDHFKCASPACGRPLIDVGFVEEKNQLHCEFCWEKDLAPMCSRCQKRIKNECLNAIGQHFHPTCFTCTHCKCVFGNNPFFLEDGEPYCDADWNEMFTTKCHGCGFPIEAGDRWVEAMNNSYHSQCFNCSACKKNLEGTSFFAKGGRPFCKAHAR